MRLLCSGCGNPLENAKDSCPVCGESQDVRSVLKRLLEKVGFFFNRATAVSCPVCHKTGSLKFGYCTHCGCNFTVASAVAPLLRGPCKKWNDFVGAPTPRGKLRLQRFLLLASVLVFIAVLSIFQHFKPEEMFPTTFLTFMFLLLLLLLFFWLKPAPNPRRRPLSRLVKLALVFNYFTVLLVLELAVIAWHEKAAIIAGLCVMSVIAFFIFSQFVWPIWWALSEAFRPQTTSDRFDSTAFQGHRARYQYRRTSE